MKLDMNTVLKDFNDKPLVWSENGVEITLRKIFTDSLLNVTKSSQNETGTLKYDRYKLATIINCSDKPDLSIDDLKKLKDYVGEMYLPLIVGVVWDIIDNIGNDDT
ncbi:hypothetical protein LCGC14_1950170 [marine sediment metagenome]|uniref:Uncharacterized protein n=1 Tax=marine sediment metagenome TaxID=412755 RepID=A0A0F9FI13_9ZZZZ